MTKEICNLIKTKCLPHKSSTLPLSRMGASTLLKKLNSSWKINDLGHLYKEFLFSDFLSAMNFANKITNLAENVGHHPNFQIAWGSCICEIWTQKIGGLSNSDFYLAEKIELLINSGEK